MRDSPSAPSTRSRIGSVTTLYQQQAVELDHQKREAILHKMQQDVIQRVIFAPIWQWAFLNGVGSRVGESGFGLIPRFPYTAPYEGPHAEGRLGFPEIRYVKVYEATVCQRP